MNGVVSSLGRATRSGRSRLATIAIALGLVLAFFLSVAVQYSTIIANDDPEAALRLWPSAQARSRLAERLLTIDGPQAGTQRAQALQLAREALSREPLNVVAARAIASVEAFNGQDTAARQAINYAEQLSRRDLQTQVWLIEDAVSRGDVAAALRHYDLALTTTAAGYNFLMPVLVRATTTPEVTSQLMVMIAHRPLWTNAFLSQLIDGAPDLRAMARIISAAQLDPDDPLEQSLLARALTRLFDTGNFQKAYQLYYHVAKDADRALPLRDGGFGRTPQLPPFDWWFDTDADLNAVPENVGTASDPALSINAQSGHSGIVATQATILQAGRYDLAATVGSADNTGILPSVAVRCEPSGVTLVTLAFKRPGRLSQRFEVPSECTAQRVQVLIDPGLDRGANAWLDSVTLNPAKG